MKLLIRLLLLTHFLLGYAALQSASAQSTFFSFYFRAGGINHYTLMSMEGQDIHVWVKYYDSDYKGNVIVHQNGTAIAGKNGIVILCDTPTYDGTNIPANYSPDNFYIIRNSYGYFTIYNLDDQGVYADVFALKELKTKADFLNAVRMFR